MREVSGLHGILLHQGNTTSQAQPSPLAKERPRAQDGPSTGAAAKGSQEVVQSFPLVPQLCDSSLAT